MFVLKIIALVLAWLVLIAFAICALLFVLLLPRVGFALHVYSGGKVEGRISYGFVRVHVRHMPKRDAATKTQSKQTPEPSKPASRPSWPSGLSDIDLGDGMVMMLEFLDDVKERLRIDALCVELTLATGDAAKTGLYIGYLSALSGMLYPFLVRNFNMKRCSIVLDGDFQGAKTRYDVRFDLSFRPVCLLGAGLRHGLRLYRVVRKTQTMEAKSV
nr:DUF2953 domain-containing protein [uncultured Butyricicoccus sp.]